MNTGFDFADIVDEVMARALGETTTAADVASAKRSIYMVLEDWHAQQFNTWRIKTLETGFVSGVPTVALPMDLDDVLTVNAVSNASMERITETPMQRISETEYSQLTTKLTTGLPTQFVLHRTEPPSMTCVPAGRYGRTETIRITYIKRPEMYDRFGTSVDAPARWVNPLIFGAAADLAMKNPDRSSGRAENLSAMYQRALTLALANDRQRTSFRMRIG
jgi:hypothetical protein